MSSTVEMPPAALTLQPAGHALDHQGHVLKGGPGGGKAGAGLDIVGPGLADDVAHFALFIVGQQAGLDDDP